MAIFSFGKGKDGPADPDQVLAYLEEAMRTRSPFTLAGERGRESAALVHSVSEEARSFRLLPKEDLPWAKGDKVAFTFIHDGLRLGGAARAVEVRPGILALALPDSLAVMERRGSPRARMNPKELATLTALQDLFEGVGITGSLENLGEGGARVRVDKAVAIGSEKRLVLGSKLVPVGQRFLVVKLNKVPRCPAVMEVEGKVVYLGHEGALVMGLSFGKPPAPVAAAVRNLVAQRCPPVPATLPPKVRRRPEPRDQENPTEPRTSVPRLEPLPAPKAEDPAERRQFPRLTLGGGFHARFMAGDDLISEADLLDLSTGGCCLRLPLDRCREIRQGADLDEFHFLHPDLPREVLRCRVRWVLGRSPEALETGAPGRYCLVGVEFVETPEAAGRAIEAYLARHLPG